MTNLNLNPPADKVEQSLHSILGIFPDFTFFSMAIQKDGRCPVLGFGVAVYTNLWSYYDIYHSHDASLCIVDRAVAR